MDKKVGFLKTKNPGNRYFHLQKDEVHVLSPENPGHCTKKKKKKKDTKTWREEVRSSRNLRIKK